MTEPERLARLEEAQNEYQRGALKLQDDMQSTIAPFEEQIDAAKRVYARDVEVLRRACASKKSAIHETFKKEQE